MWGFLVELLSGALMSIQGVFNTEVTKQTSLWVSTGWVQFSAFLVCVLAWFFTGRDSVGALWQVENKYTLLGGVIGAFITITVIQSMGSLGPAKAAMLIVISQLAVAYMIELFGLFGVEKAGFEWRKLIGMAVATAVSFFVASCLLKITGNKSTDEDLIASAERSKAMKQEGKDILNKEIAVKEEPKAEVKEKITNVAFACDAGLGSSAMGAGAFRKKLKEKGIEITVKHYAIERVPEEAQVVVTHENLLERAKIAMPDKRIVTIKNFLGDPKIDQLLQEIVEQQKDGE